MAESDLISVIVPAHNSSRFIRRTLESALAQTHENLEVIVVDDESHDDTSEIVSEFARRDSRVKLVTTPRIGVSAARNLAIANSRADLIATLDADDLWHPRKLERQLAAFKAAGGRCGAVYCWSAGIDEDDRIVLPIWNGDTATGMVFEQMVVRGLLGNGSTPLISRQAISAAGGYDESLSLCEDWKFYTALAAVCEFAVVPDVLTGYRLHDSASVRVREMEAAIARVTEWIVLRWPGVSENTLRERRHIVSAYLAALAIRAREFPLAARYLARAWSARPVSLFDPAYLRLFFMFAAHAAGLRVYRWDFWRKPDFAKFCKAEA